MGQAANTDGMNPEKNRDKAMISSFLVSVAKATQKKKAFFRTNPFCIFATDNKVLTGSNTEVVGEKIVK